MLIYHPSGITPSDPLSIFLLPALLISTCTNYLHILDMSLLHCVFVADILSHSFLVFELVYDIFGGGTPVVQRSIVDD